VCDGFITSLCVISAGAFRFSESHCFSIIQAGDPPDPRPLRLTNCQRLCLAIVNDVSEVCATSESRPMI